MEQSRERSSALPYHLGVVAMEKGSLRVTLDYGRQLYLLKDTCWRESHPSAEMQSVFSEDLADWSIGLSLGSLTPFAEMQSTYSMAPSRLDHRDDLKILINISP